MIRYLLMAGLVAGCGRTLPNDDADAGLVVTAGEVVNADAGSTPWCAAENAPCLANGWEYAEPGHCCVSRMTCFKAPGSASGVCAFSNWCAGEAQPCRANGTERDLPGHCCNARMTCFASGCAY